MLDLTGYRLTFDDEFTTLSVSANGTGTTWADTRPLSLMRPGVDIGFGQSAFVDPSTTGIQPFALADGALRITAAPATGQVADLVYPGLYASGLLHTMNSFSQAYGYFEMRAQLPAEPGTWPGFWLLRADGHWPPELDVVETYGANPTALVSSVHTGLNGGDTFQQVWTSQPTLVTGFHTFGALWTPQTVTFYYDGDAVGQLATPSDMQGAMYPLIALAMSRDVPGITGHANSMLVDYVRAYSSAASAVAVPLGSVSSPDGLSTADLHGATTSTPATPTPAPATAPVAAAGLTLHVSGDMWAGGPKFTVAVDGHQVGGVYEVTAEHAAGATQDVTIAGSFTPGAHTVAVTFINDAHGTPTYDPSSGWHMNDRNLYVSGLSLGGVDYGVDAMTANSAARGCDWLDPHAAVMVDNGTATFGVTLGSQAVPATPVAPVPPAASSSPVATPPTPAPAALPSDTLSFRVSGDSWMGGPQFQVAVDGKVLDGLHEVTAAHGSQSWQEIAVSGAFGSGPHKVDVSFVNDGHGTPVYDPATGWQMNDRNLYVEDVALNGHAYGVGAVIANTASAGCDWLDPHAAVLVANGTATFLLE